MGKGDWRKVITWATVILLVSLIAIPMLFNFTFMWESGLSRGKSSDWFVLYGNIFGGLIGGGFTYLALMLTFKEQKKDSYPLLYLPKQNMDFIEDANPDNGLDLALNQIHIDFYNVGSTIAQDIECTIKILDFENTLKKLKENYPALKIEDNYRTIGGKIVGNEGKLISAINEGEEDIFIGTIHQQESKKFIGSCIPLVINEQAKSTYIMDDNLKNLMSYLVIKRKYNEFEFKEDVLFQLLLDLKYYSAKYNKHFQESYILNLTYLGIYGENDKIIFKYILDSEII